MVGEQQRVWRQAEQRIGIFGERPVIWSAWNIPFLKRSGEEKADRCVWEGGPFADPASFPQREGRQVGLSSTDVMEPRQVLEW